MKSNRIRIIYIILGLALIAELAVVFVNSGTVEGISERADKLKVYATALCDDNTILPGDILDRNGNPVVSTGYKEVVDTDEDGSQTTSTVRVTEYNDAEAYSQIVGYTGSRNLDPMAESVDTVIGSRNAYGLMAFLDNDYWGENGLYSTVDIDGTKGQNVSLTIDNGLQEAVYDALCGEMSSSDDMGSAVVMDARTGEILSMVSFPAYDFNDLSTAVTQMNEDAENTGLEPGYPVTYKNSETPGSIFKVLMSVALIDHGMEDFTAENTALTVNNWTCSELDYNSGTLTVSPGDTIDLETALNISSNVYFASAALALGKENLRETASKFMLNENSFTDEDNDGKDDNDGHTEDEDTTYLSSDFGKIQYYWNLDVEDDVLAQTGFGQGETELTTVYAAMIAQAIANDGEMMQPYLIKSLTDANGKVVYEGKETLLSNATSRSTANKVTSYLQSTAMECCQEHELYSVREIFDRYDVAGKTGTAENGDSNSTINAWYLSFAPADDPEYVVVVNQCRNDKSGYRMMSAVADIYEYLFEEY